MRKRQVKKYLNRAENIDYIEGHGFIFCGMWSRDLRMAKRPKRWQREAFIVRSRRCQAVYEHERRKVEYQGMTTERYMVLHREEDSLTPEEIAAGWHYCAEWDELLVGPGMQEMDVCLCFKETK